MIMQKRYKSPAKSDDVILEIAEELHDIFIYLDEVSDALSIWKGSCVTGKAYPDNKRSEHHPRGASAPAARNNPSLNPHRQSKVESDLVATSNDAQLAAEAIQQVRGRLEHLFSLLECAWKSSTQSSPS